MVAVVFIVHLQRRIKNFDIWLAMNYNSWNCVTANTVAAKFTSCKIVDNMTMKIYLIHIIFSFSDEKKLKIFKFKHQELLTYKGI